MFKLAISGLVVVLVKTFLFGWFVQMLWNLFFPPVFGLEALTFTQGLVLYVLSSFLFGSDDAGR